MRRSPRFKNSIHDVLAPTSTAKRYPSPYNTLQLSALLKKALSCNDDCVRTERQSWGDGLTPHLCCGTLRKLRSHFNIYY
ncbi:hypothetical protein [Nostoc commune]|uniref:hypothetical protein n=1 Tax=Nostoc commune TaxID=1178 RepID=UPI002072D4D8|nr:hypothetical protein [Nostoc commune]